MITLLFVDSSNNKESLIAESFAKKITHNNLNILSAGLISGIISPEIKQFLQNNGMDVENITTTALKDLYKIPIDIVITLDDNTHKSSFLLSGTPTIINWHVFDSDINKLAENIEQHINSLFNNGFLSAITAQRHNFINIMKSLPNGVIIHDLNRTIVYISPEAEKITGYSQHDTIGKDCHSIFKSTLCGKNCQFCNIEANTRISESKYSSTFISKDGEFKEIDVSVVPLTNEYGDEIGILTAINDQTKLHKLEREVEETFQFSGIIGQDHKMQQIYDLIKNLAESDFPVAIFGESGTGKELVAHALHNESSRKQNLFVPINCGALPEGTIESELFGHVKGAFTGAFRDKKGRFSLADGGTIFLDEVGELSQTMQVKILRVLQEGTFEPVGGETTHKVDVRIISATNKNLRDMVKNGTFREDLYYRLAVVPIELPPLRERRNDIPLLANHFLKEICSKNKTRDFKFSPETITLLMSYSWPGNIRQLQNAIKYSTIMCRENVIKPNHFPPEITELFDINDTVPQNTGQVGRKPKLTEKSVKYALDKTDGNKAKAARILGVGRATLYNFLENQKKS